MASQKDNPFARMKKGLKGKKMTGGEVHEMMKRKGAKMNPTNLAMAMKKKSKRTEPTVKMDGWSRDIEKKQAPHMKQTPKVRKSKKSKAPKHKQAPHLPQMKKVRKASKKKSVGMIGNIENKKKVARKGL